MFGDSPQTPYDLNFKLMGVPVRVHPFFWLITLAFGLYSGGRAGGLSVALTWVAAVFISILWHEFGHVLAARTCHWGVDEVVLHQFGGYAALRPPVGKKSPVNEILISLAGPCAGFLLYGGIWLLWKFAPEALTELGETGLRFWTFLLFINLYWGLFNLLPIFPLDGGKAARTFLMAIAPGGAAAAALISLITAAGMALYMFREQNIWMAIMMIMLGFMNLQLLQRS